MTTTTTSSTELLHRPHNSVSCPMSLFCLYIPIKVMPQNKAHSQNKQTTRWHNKGQHSPVAGNYGLGVARTNNTKPELITWPLWSTIIVLADWPLFISSVPHRLDKTRAQLVPLRQSVSISALSTCSGTSI